MRKFRGLPVLKYARYVSKSVALPWTSKKISKLIYHIWHPLYLHPVILKNSRTRYPSVQFSKGKKCQISQSAAFLISRHSFRFLSDSWYIPTYIPSDESSPKRSSLSQSWALKVELKLNLSLEEPLPSQKFELNLRTSMAWALLKILSPSPKNGRAWARTHHYV